MGEAIGDIAIVGIGCRFPGGANDPESFWKLLEQGFNAVGEAPASRPGFRELFDADPKVPGRTYSRWGGFLDRVDLFDAKFFGVSPREAVHIDPQHRLLLELVWEACEDAGIPPSSLAGTRAGVFVGISTHDYGDLQMYPQHRADIDMHTNSGVATSIAANRISYLYDLRGPSVAIDTACSSALTAVHFACQSLRSGECTTAVAGGVQLLLAPELTIGFSKALMLSKDGECRAFDASANGYVRSEGAGVILLKPLAAALAAGDRVYAVIRASAANQDGRTNGMTVPSPVAQQAMIEEALDRAGIAPADVQYVEMHGTGTPVGDPIEARAVGAALHPGRGENEFCAIGSVKTNLGHLEAASGMPALIKVALALGNRRIPASLHFKNPNPAIDLQACRLRVVTSLEGWPAPDRPLIAGVNSFGFGGANAHVVLQEAPRPPASDGPEAAMARLLTISARSAEALRILALAYADRLKGTAEPGDALRDICFTAAERRGHHEHRLAVVATRRDDFATHLVDFSSGAANVNVSSGRAADSAAPKLAFVFSGMGPQWWGMGRQLRATEPVFRRMLERCDAALRPYSGWSLLDELAADESASRVADPELAQVTNFAIQVALAELWASWGIKPDAVIGHSGGAMAAAYTAGIHTLEDALRLTFHRSRLQGRPENGGKMLAVGAAEAEIQSLLAGKEHLISLAAVNGPASITLSGDGDTLEQICATLKERQIFARMLTVTIAYHSPAMDKIEKEFLAAVPALRAQAAQIPFLSDTTGTWATGEECDENYWWRAIRQPVLFREGIRQILASGVTNFLEISPHPVLVPSLLECMKESGTAGLALASVRRKEDERVQMLRALGALYTIGRLGKWNALRESGAHLVNVPGHPWQRERHWFEPSSPEHLPSEALNQAGDHPLLGARTRSARPLWERLVGRGDTDYLQEHIVQGSPVFPGAAYVEMALATKLPLAATAAALRSCTTLSNVEFQRPLVLRTDRATPLQLALDPEDGRFEVYSSAGDGQAWICHARGTVTAQPLSDRPRFDREKQLERIGQEVAPEAFYAQMAERHLLYGPVFRGIVKLWAARREAVGLITVESLGNCAGYCVQPALLDAAFQLLVAAVESEEGLAGNRRLFLPTNIREFLFLAPPGGRFWATAKVVEATEAAVVGDILIVAEDGEVCADIRGFTARLADSTGPGSRGAKDGGLYEYRWEELPLEPRAPSTLSLVLGALPTLDAEVARARAAAEARSVETGWRQYYEKVEGRLNELAAAYIAEAALSQAPPAEGWRKALANQALEILARCGTPRTDAGTLAAELLRDFPAHRLDVELLRRCGPQLAGIVAGRTNGQDVLFAGDGFTFLETFYRASPASAFYNALAADLVAAFAQGFENSRPIRILEVGAGTGGTTSVLLERLNPANTSYVFSDVSQVFLDRAKAGFARRYPFVATRLFDVTKPANEQGLTAGSFDLVIAANALHATPDVRAGVERLRDLLAPGGALLLLEITSHPYWLDIVFGLTDGWWKFEDRQLRPNHPLMTGGQWRQLLATAGFETPTVIADLAPAEPAQSVIFGRRSVADGGEKTRWLVLADEGGVGARLASALEAQGVGSVLHYAAHSDLAQVRAEAAKGDFAGVAYLWGLDVPPLAEASGGEAEFAAAQRLGCGGVLAVLQQLVADSPLAERGFALVTAGAQAVGAGEVPSLLQGPLWGLGRVILKERTALGCRMIDLSPASTDEELASLAREMAEGNWKGGEDEEICYRQGLRLVHRLRLVTFAQLAESLPALAAGPEDRWQAEMGASGGLDSLRLRQAPRPAPAPHEVEIAIRAASLNFRDVVVALGAVEGMESENSFGNRKLGLDLAGVVTRCGDAVEHLRPGDEVLGVLAGAFASFALAHAALMVRKPPRLSAEQAACIPVAFVTAHYALRHLARLARGESVLIHLGSGGVGLAAVQIAQRCGARIFATAGSPAKRDYLRSIGVTDVMDSRSLGFADEIARLTGGRGVDVVLNALSGEAMDRGVAALAPFGRFVELGKTDIYQNRPLQLLPFKRNLSYYSVDIDRMCFERADFVGALLGEVVAELAAGTLEPIPYTAFPMLDLKEALRFVAQAKHIGKVVVTNLAPVAMRRALPERALIRTDATYLITGGWGGVGLLSARWLFDQGARQVVLVGRTRPSLEAELQIKLLRDDGLQVETIAADVSQPSEVARVLAFVRTRMAPLRGILHGAMVLADTPLPELDEPTFSRVMGPKAQGAWNLHTQTAGEELDFFVLFSSIASLLGNPFQANYAAANAFLDSLAVYRRALGLKATSINWGVIGGTGFLARNQAVAEYLERQGYGSFTEAQTLEVLAEVLRYAPVQVMAARIDWKRFAEFAPRAAASPRIRHLIPAAEEERANATAGSLRLSLVSVSGPERLAAVEQYLREQVAKLLGASLAAIEPERPITELGLDSLIAAELTVVLERDLNVQVTGTKLLSGISIRALAQDVLGEMDVADAPADGPPPVPAPAAPAPAPAPAPESTPAVALHPIAAPPSVAAIAPGPTTTAEAVPPPAEPRSASPVAGRVDYATLDYGDWTGVQKVARAAATAAFRALARIEAKHLERIPRSGACILAVNHLSMADVPLLLSLLPRRTIILANDRLKQTKALDFFVSDLGQAIYVTRDQPDEESLRMALAVLRAGGLLALSPEGTRSKSGGLLRGKTGVAWLATQLGVPVVPLVAWGQERWRMRFRQFGRIPVDIRVAAPVHLPMGGATPAQLRQYTDQIMVTMAGMLPPEYRGVYAAPDEPAAAREDPGSNRR